MFNYLFEHFLLDPLAWVLLLLAAGLIAGWRGHAVWQWRLTVGATALLFALAILPLDLWLARPLENEYPRPPLPAHVDGIVVLDGAFNAAVFASRHVAGENMSTLRMIAGVDLARRFPQAKFVYSGETGQTPRQKAVEHQAALALLSTLGVAPDRTIFETTSRDTGENIANAMRIVHPKPGETWMLVTSAVHMPRAVAIARKLGWKMVPWPSDYITPAGRRPGLRVPSEGLVEINRALHEWFGLAAYRLGGRT